MKSSADHKGAADRWGAMSLLVVGFGLLSVGAAGLFGYAVHRANQKMITLLDMQTLLRESQSTHFHHLNQATEEMMSDISTLQSTLDLSLIHI